VLSGLSRLTDAIRRAELTRRLGTVTRLHGLVIESSGPRTQLGELCAILPPGGDLPEDAEGVLLDAAEGRRTGTLVEVVGIQPGRVTLMPYGDTRGLAIGSTVVALGNLTTIPVGNALLGRVIDAFGYPLDGRPRPVLDERRPLAGVPMNPMRRPRIARALETGIRSVDALLTLGHGQRVGIFAGSGVGKSTLLGMIARHVKADVNVIALIGERGREVREFIEKQLGAEGLARSVVVVATADQPALSRIRAARAACAVAEHFRERGLQVLLTMDSVTRFAMARREVGLSAGEPATARGYTPSVFAELPELCERCGTAPGGGSITALFTVLVEGDDLNEPISDALRAILDGHVVLSRHLANQGHYPAIDLLKSASRVLPDVTTVAEREQVREAIRLLALLDRNRQMIELGAYEKGSNPEIDAAVARQPRILQWLRQSEGGVARADALRELASALELPPDPAGPRQATPERRLPTAAQKVAPPAAAKPGGSAAIRPSGAKPDRSTPAAKGAR
jgi:flagellum-specific ATP synthase